MKRLNKKIGIILITIFVVLSGLMFSTFAVLVIPHPFNWALSFLGLIITVLTLDKVNECCGS